MVWLATHHEWSLQPVHMLNLYLQYKWPAQHLAAASKFSVKTASRFNLRRANFKIFLEVAMPLDHLSKSMLGMLGMLHTLARRASQDNSPTLTSTIMVMLMIIISMKDISNLLNPVLDTVGAYKCSQQCLFQNCQGVKLPPKIL